MATILAADMQDSLTPGPARQRQTRNMLANSSQARRMAQAALNLGLVAAWLWLYHPLFGYLGLIATREDFRTNQIALLGICALIGFRGWQSRKTQPLRLASLAIDDAPRLHWVALILTVVSSATYVLASRLLDINTVSATLFGLATYGLLGLWLSPSRWRSGLPAALLLIGVLPFAEHMQTFIGYPIRIATAEVVRRALASVGVGSVGVDTILIFENGVSLIDIPCSGVKSLWTGLLFLIAATWIDRRPIHWRWLGVATAFLGLLLCANLARVAVLVTVGEVLHWRVLAELIHVPLGILMFALACLAALGLLRWVPRSKNKTKDEPDRSRVNTSSELEVEALAGSKIRWLTPALLALVVALSLVYAPRPRAGLQAALPQWQFASQLQTTAQPLRADELDWLTRDGADSAQRFSFVWHGGQRDITGSMMLIPSRTWRAHHRPERCFEVFGLTLNDSRMQLVAQDFPVRRVSLGGTGTQPQATAIYWFQARNRITDDYGTRIWADVSPKPERWVLVSMLLAGDVDPQQPDTRAWLNAMRATVSRELNEAMVR